MTDRAKWLVWMSLVLLLPCLFAGCKRDPEARKKSYVDKATSYFQRGKYPEATIEYENALQIDPIFADAHYGLAQCFLKQVIFRSAYQELLSTVEIDPANRKAQLDLGNLLLAGRNTAEARKHAENVVHDDPQNVEAQIL